MTRLAWLSVLLIPAAAAASGPLETMVYMREDPAGGKQIWEARADGSGARPLTEEKAWHLYPSITPDGRQVSYVVGPDDKNLAVVVRRRDSGTLEQWTPSQGAHLHTDFSGLGDLLAFTGPYGPDGKDRIAVIDLRKAREADRPDVTDGRAVYQTAPRVIESPLPAYFPALSSDGSFLIEHRTLDKEHKEVVEVDLSTGKEKVLTAGEKKCMAPSLSFDDQLVAFTCLIDGNWDVYELERSSGRIRRITTDPAEDFAPTFTPENHIVFAAKRVNGHFGLYLAETDAFGGAVREKPLVTVEGADLYAPSVSGDLRYAQGELAPVPAPARSSFGAVEHRGKIYVAGGHAGPEHSYQAESFVGKFECYDVAIGKWEALAPRPTATQGFELVADGDYLYAFGGFAYAPELKPSWRSLDVIDRYSISKNAWERVGKLPRPRSSYVAARVGSTVYLIGGWDATPQLEGDEEGRFHRKVDAFDLKTLEAKETGHKLPGVLRRAFTGVVADGKIILLGGLGTGSAHFDLLDKVTEFDPSAGTWKELPPLPFPTFAPAAGLLDGTLYTMGGLLRTGPGPKDFAYVPHVFRYDAGAGKWAHTGRYLKQSKGFARVLPLGEGSLAIIGGHARRGEVDQPVSDFETFSLSPPRGAEAAR